MNKNLLIRAEILKAEQVADDILEQKRKKKAGLAKKGKCKRHYAQRRKLNSPGFGATYQAPQSWFRVEFCWWDRETEEESDYQVHWVACRKFTGEERKFLYLHLRDWDKREFIERETIEAHYAMHYIVHFLCTHKEKLKVNQCFIYPAGKRNDETIRCPLYQIRWTENLCSHEMSLGVRSTLYNCIEHFDENNNRIKILDLNQ